MNLVGFPETGEAVDAEAQWESLDLPALERAARLRGLCITGAVRRIVLGRLRRYERYVASLGEDIDGVALEEPNPAVARPGVHDGEELSSSELAELRDLQRGHRFRRLLLLDTAVLVQDLDQPEVTTGSSNWVSTAADAPAAPILAVWLPLLTAGIFLDFPHFETRFPNVFLLRNFRRFFRICDSAPMS